MKDNIKLLNMAVINSIYYYSYEKLFTRAEKLKKKKVISLTSSFNLDQHPNLSNIAVSYIVLTMELYHNLLVKRPQKHHSGK